MFEREEGMLTTQIVDRVKTTNSIANKINYEHIKL